MANNTNKVYTVQIRMDAARAALDATNKQLAELDKKLEGLDRNSEAARALIADMAKLAKEVEGLTDEVTDLGSQLDSLQPGTVGALRAEVEDMERALDATTKGTAEYNAALLALGRRKSELKDVDDAIDALNSTAQAGALVDFANGIVGVAGVASVAAQALGVSAESAAEYEQKLQTVVAVTSSFEAISKAVNAESRANIKNLIAQARAYFASGSAATASGNAARVAIASTGIGLLLIAVGALVANWEELTRVVAGSQSSFVKVKAIANGLFDAAIQGVKDYYGSLYDLVTFDFDSLAERFKNGGQRMQKAFGEGRDEVYLGEAQRLRARQLVENEQLLKIQQAAGKDSYELERKILQDKLFIAKEKSDEEKATKRALQGDLDALDRAHALKQQQAAEAAALARLERVAAIEDAKGNEAFGRQLKFEERKLAGLRAAAQPNEAEITRQLTQIALLKEKHEQDQEARRRQAITDAGAQEASLLEQAGKDSLAVRTHTAKLLLDGDKTDSQRERDQKLADQRAYDLLLAEGGQRQKQLLQDQADERASLAAQDAEIDARFAAGAAEGAAEAYARGLARAAAERARKSDLGFTLIKSVFGLEGDKAAALKQAITESVSVVYASLQELGGALLAGATAAADRQLADVQGRLQRLDQQLSDRAEAAKQAEQELEGASGARREYLLSQLERERQAVQRAAEAKRRAAAEEIAATKEKQRLEKLSAELTAASTLATNLATAAAAVFAGVKAVSGAAAVPFPGSLPAIAAAIAAVVGAVASAKQLSNAAKFADGGILAGPSHAGGGVGLFSRSGAYYGEAEGGEAITPADATRHNGPLLEVIRTKGRTRPLTMADFAEIAAQAISFAPPPAGYYPGRYANGGTLGAGSLPAGAASAADVNALRADVARTNALLEQVVKHTGMTASSTSQTASYGPAQLAIGPWEAMQIEAQRQRALDAERSAEY